jgi:hypothetical protein
MVLAFCKKARSMFYRRRKTLWLVADDPEGTWWCDCREGIVDAPWHSKELSAWDGSGWLWTCVSCSRAFMFARAEFIRRTLDELAERGTPRIQRFIDPKGTDRVQTLLATPDDWLAIVQPLAKRLEEGQRYVFFDGQVLPAKSGPVKFTGLFRSHDLPELPHLSDALVQETIGNPDYWVTERGVP